VLALTRRIGESIIIGNEIEITVVEVKGDQVRIGIQAPKNVKIYRKEIFEEIQTENRVAAELSTDSINGLELAFKKFKKPKWV